MPALAAKFIVTKPVCPSRAPARRGKRVSLDRRAAVVQPPKRCHTYRWYRPCRYQPEQRWAMRCGRLRFLWQQRSTNTSRARVDAARASDMRLANARLAALAVVLGIVAVAAQDDLDLDFDPTQQDVRSALVLSRFLAPFEMKVVASGADTRSPTRWTATGARSGSRRPPTCAR